MAEQALLATHGDPLVGRALVRTISSKFSVEHVFNLEQMLVHCRQREYGLYVMDLNLGYEAALNIIPAQTIYALLQERGIEKLEKKVFKSKNTKEKKPVNKTGNNSLGDRIIGLRDSGFFKQTKTENSATRLDGVNYF